MRRNSREQTDGIEWQTVSLPLGTTGLDLRRPDAPMTLSDLVNARFLDARTVERRGGHDGQLIQDESEFTQNKVVLDWVYGHGTQISVNDDEDWENKHHPIHTRGGGTFQHKDTDLVWTGDRLLVAKDGAFSGQHYHWNRNGDDTPVEYGIPAYFPVQEDRDPPDEMSGSLVDMCLTEELQLVMQTTDDDRVEVIITSRETGVILDQSLIDDDTGVPGPIRVINSGGIPVALWLQNDELVESHWLGTAWSNPTSIDTLVDWFDVAVVPGGYHVAWLISGQIYIGKVLRENAVDSPYIFGSGPGFSDATGAFTIAVSPGGDIAFVCETTGDGLVVETYTPEMNNASEASARLSLAGSSAWVGGMTACYRGLTNEVGHYPLIVYAADSDSVIDTTQMWEVTTDDPAQEGYELEVAVTDRHWNSVLASKAFRVGDEVFAWLRGLNSSTNYLVAGVHKANVCGIADREEALDAEGVLPGVAVDPLVADGTQLAWARPYNAGVYTRPGNIRLGYLNFLPKLSTASFGRSTYIAGSHVRNWDGIELGDAGFNDYPVVVDPVDESVTGDLTLNGVYYWRVYAVRYNRAGERFQSVAVNTDEDGTTLSGANQTATLTIKTIPITNHEDVVFEVYRTETTGTTFYLEGTVANDRDIDEVEFVSSMSDIALRDRPADPHAPGIGNATELDELGPFGCETIIAAGDRLWCIGGQVPAGIAHYSKLYEQGEGAGFYALDSELVVDATGGDIKSITGFADAAVVIMLKDRIAVIQSDGPNNYGEGTFGIPRLVVTEGAETHRGTVVLPIGIAFWGAGGPRVLGTNFQVMNICEQIRPLSETLTPTGVTVDLNRREVVWYTEEGDALLWNYASGSRWARWTGLPVAGCSARRLVTPDGRFLTPSSTPRDDGRRFEFMFSTGNIRPELLMADKVMVHRVGMVGKHNGPHKAKFKVFYNDAPLWSELFKWEPMENTFLTPFEDYEDLTPAEVDALSPRTEDSSGQYQTHKRVKRMHCRMFRVEVSDCGDDGFTPWELTFELGHLPGMGRTPINTFTK